MSESQTQLRLRHISDYTPSTDNIAVSRNMSSRSSGDRRPSNQITEDLTIDQKSDDNACDNQNESAIRKKFSKNEKQELIELLYSEEVTKSKKNKNKIRNTNTYHESSESEPEPDNGHIMTSFMNDKRPLLHSANRTKRKSPSKPFKSNILYTNFDEDIEDRVVYEESVWSLGFQVFVPFLIAGFGTVGAGLVLDYVQHWDVFRKVSEVFILVPALLGLKGNLEMTLASRLSTQANLGHIQSGREQWLIASGNIALIQCQATIVAFLAAVFAITMDWLPEGEFNFNHALLLCASSLLTASIASFILGLLMILVVFLSHKCHINPDNVATPIAASLGDLTTLALLAKFSNILYYTVDDSPWLCASVLVVYLALIPVWCYIADRNKYTNEVLYNGWTPVISAMAISSIGGCILDFAVSRFKGIAVFQPVINGMEGHEAMIVSLSLMSLGVGGNLAAVQASRISTYLHKKSKLGTLPRSDSKLCFDPCSAVFGKNLHARTVRVLLVMVIPGHLIFTYAIQFLQAGHTSVTFHFLVIYLLAALLQVLLLLYFAHIMILWMWKRAIDPDNSAIPYLTALGDLLGTALLAIAFLILFSVGDKDSDVGD